MVELNNPKCRECEQPMKSNGCDACIFTCLNPDCSYFALVQYIKKQIVDYANTNDQGT